MYAVSGDITPFGSTALIIVDGFRIFSIAVYMIIMAMTITVAVNGKQRYFAPATIWGLYSIIILGMSAAGTELQKLGHSIFEGGFWWRLPINVIGVIVSVITVQKVRSYPIEPPRKSPWR